MQSPGLIGGMEKPYRLVQTPRTIDIEIISRCNLRCDYCYHFNNPATNCCDLPTDEWVAFFRELGTLGVMSVTLAGGEPFLRADLKVLLAEIVAQRMRYSILSNGALIDDGMASFIAETRRCDSVQISIDGSRPEIHDSCRGEGAFFAAVRGIKILQRNGVRPSVRVTIHRRNVGDLENTAQMLLDELGVPGFSTNAAGFLGSCRLNSEAILLDPEQRQMAMQILLSLSERYPGRISANAGPLAEGTLWKKMERARCEQAPAFAHGGALTGCGCPNSKLAVRSDGHIVPCLMLAHLDLGRIGVDSLLDVWRHSKELQTLRDRRSIALSEFAFCVGCPYVPYCTGNCPGLAFSILGKVDHPSPDACLNRFLAAGGKLP